MKLVIDIETTHLDPYQGDILQVAMRAINGDGTNLELPIMRTYYTEFSDSQTASAIKINKLTPERIAELRTFKCPRHFKDDVAYWQKLIDASTHIIAHNAHFDINWLKHHGVNFEGKEIVCTMLLMNKYKPVKGRWSMKKSFEEFFPGEYQEEEAHGASYDTHMCAHVYLKLTEKEKNAAHPNITTEV